MRLQSLSFAFFTDPIIQLILGGVFALKQWIISSLKHDTVPRVNNLYCFYVKNPQNVLHYGIVKTVNYEQFITVGLKLDHPAPFIITARLRPLALQLDVDAALLL